MLCMLELFSSSTETRLHGSSQREAGHRNRSSWSLYRRKGP